MAVTNLQILKEVTHIKAILIGDGTPESMEDSIQYRLTRVEKTVNANGNGQPPRNNGDHNKRKMDQPKFKYMRYALFISLVGLIASNIATCAWVAKNVSVVLESMPK